MDRDAPRPHPGLLRSLGTALPAHRRSQREVEAELAEAWRLAGRELARWRRIARGAGVDRRFGVRPIRDTLHASTAARMSLYEELAPPLAAAAANEALDEARVAPERVTDLLLVSCTGFSAPGVDVALVDRLGLSRDVRRTTVGFMGCFGAITGLRAATAVAAADPHAVALLVCVELCTLHVRPDPDPENQVASALFGDGAAAAVVAGERADLGALAPPPIGRVGLGSSLLARGGRDAMTWRITDHGFAMTLSPEVPKSLRASLQRESTGGVAPIRTRCVHPGGPKILDAVEASMPGGLPGRLDDSRAVLRECGNMSSPTVLFVLKRALRRAAPLPAELVAFGPGLTVERLTLEPVASRAMTPGRTERTVTLPGEVNGHAGADRGTAGAPRGGA